MNLSIMVCIKALKPSLLRAHRIVPYSSVNDTLNQAEGTRPKAVMLNSVPALAPDE